MARFFFDLGVLFSIFVQFFIGPYRALWILNTRLSTGCEAWVKLAHQGAYFGFRDINPCLVEIPVTLKPRNLISRRILKHVHIPGALRERSFF